MSCSTVRDPTMMNDPFAWRGSNRLFRFFSASV
jgi:hypothetical protein